MPFTLNVDRVHKLSDIKVDIENSLKERSHDMLTLSLVKQDVANANVRSSVIATRAKLVLQSL